MNQDPEESLDRAEQLHHLAIKVLIKTVIKCGLWFGLAWLITRFLPGALWPWYTAFALAGIGLIFSLFALVAAFYVRSKQRRA